MAEACRTAALPPEVAEAEALYVRQLKLRERLANIFKWQNYFEVSRQTAGLTPSKPQTVKLSDDCSVEIKVLPDNQAEVKLIGKGKPIVTRRHSLAKPDALVLAGDDKNNTAWFVVLNFN